MVTMVLAAAIGWDHANPALGTLDQPWGEYCRVYRQESRPQQYGEVIVFPVRQLRADAPAFSMANPVDYELIARGLRDLATWGDLRFPLSFPEVIAGSIVRNPLNGQRLSVFGRYQLTARLDAIEADARARWGLV